MRLPDPARYANEGLAFVVEVVALVVLAWWGFTVHLVAGIAAPVAMIVVWGLFAAPKRRVQTSRPVVLLVKLGVFAAAAGAIVGLGHPVTAVVFLLVATANMVLADAYRAEPG